MIFQEEGWDDSWTLPNSLLFTLSIMTTIGYGHISPQVAILSMSMKPGF